MPAGCDLLRSLTKSEQEPVEAVVDGDLPLWLEGTLYRNGPGRYEYGDKSYGHLFDGHACIHKFNISKGRVVYSNKFLETESYKRTLNEKRLYPVFGTPDVCSNIFERCKGFFRFPDTFDNVNVNIVPFGMNQLYALTETNFMCQVDPATLEIKSRIDVTEYLATASTTFAHPHVLSPDGSTWITMGMNTKSPRWYYEFFKYEAQDEGALACDKAQRIASVPSSHNLGLSYFHSFAVTDNFIVFLEQALVFDALKMVSVILFNKSFSDALVMKKNFETRIHLIDRKTGEIHKQKFITDPFFVFHHINAYETKEESGGVNIIVDFCGYDVDKFDINKLSVAEMFTERCFTRNALATLRRIVVPLSAPFSPQPIRCELKELNSQVPFELPTINYDKFNGKAYKYAYGVNLFQRPFSIVKINVQNPINDCIQRTYEDLGDDILPSEPIFVERPNAEDEDDGVVLVMVLSNKSDFLSVLNAKDLREIARARVPQDVKAAFTFHGFFANKKVFPKLN